jgi:CHASE2 domain
MVSPSTIQLTIQKIEHTYTFGATGVKDILPSKLFKVPTVDNQQHPLPEWSKLKTAYETWQYVYQKEWQNRNPNHWMESEAEEEGEGSESIGLKQAEKTLEDRFREWLGQPALKELWEQIRKTIPVTSSLVEVLLACDCGSEDILHHLPWSGSYIDIPEICLVLTVAPQSADAARLESKASPFQPRREIKVLQIIAHDEWDSETQNQLLVHGGYLKALEEKVDRVTVISLTPENYDTPAKLEKAFWQELEAGPDILIFSGHGARNAVTHGEIHFGHGVKIHFSGHENAFREAISNGLQVAIFISCHTYHFARSLVQLGLSHAIAMREKIHVEAGSIFLEHLCECLGQYANLQHAMDHACKHLSQKEEHLSASLIPSRFRHPDAAAFQFEPSVTLQDPLTFPAAFKLWWRAWQPNRREVIALTSMLVLSMVVPVQARLYNGRTGAQAVVRDVTSAMSRPFQSMAPGNLPPVLLVTVDQESVNDARNRFDDFTANPMHRGYLAVLVKQLTQAQAKVVGIDYLFKDPTLHDQQLINAMQKSVQLNQTQFVLAQSEYSKLRPLTKIALPELTISGNIDFFPWEVELTKTSPLNAELLPFAQLLVLLKQVPFPSASPSESGAPRSRLQAQESLRQRLDKKLKSSMNSSNYLSGMQSQPSSWLANILGLQNWIDLSLPPDQIYTKVAAKDLQNQVTNEAFRTQLKKQVVMIIPGGYEKQDSEDLESVSLAVRYWCDLRPIFEWEQTVPLCRDRLTSEQFPLGKAHAYMIYQIQNGHFVYSPHAFWFILLAAVVARWATLMLNDAKVRDQQWFYFKVLLVGCLGYVVLSLGLYLLPGIALPISLPSFLFWFNLFPSVQPLLASRRPTHAEIFCSQDSPANPC